ncbi:Uncharacterised protein [Mycobacteroides abscessus subsp. abscessus]|jgi:hypothetical protein|nr:Uncharacterised protein [Mycobacteroides abscessus subsp. abscessus]SKV14948.1 Uncharacterised protein [Mycobacteroides abscessus subsp. abscessus]SLE99765.1 Uncharacterised protein [Mycobacteroides abscessus subsp. abscessus]
MTPPQWPPYYPTAKPSRRWLPVAIIVAAIIIATSVIAAVLLSRGSDTAAPASPAPTAAQNAPAQGNATETSSTCEAWPSTKAALTAIPQLPPGWDWSTPNIDTYIGNRTAAIAKALTCLSRRFQPSQPLLHPSRGSMSRSGVLKSSCCAIARTRRPMVWQLRPRPHGSMSCVVPAKR